MVVSTLRSSFRPASGLAAEYTYVYPIKLINAETLGLPSRLNMSEDDIPYTLFAVFCTAAIPTETIDEFLTLSFERSALGGMAPVLLDRPDASLYDFTHCTQPPVQPFRSGYLGRTVDELVSIFEEMVGDEEGKIHANGNFIVLHEQTLVDNSVCGVSLLGRQVESLRADFHMAVEILGAAEINLETLDEGAYAEFYERGQTVTVEAWEAQEARWAEAERKRQEQKRLNKESNS